MKQSMALVGSAVLAAAPLAQAQKVQSTTLHAPVTAIALGPSSASVDVNVNSAKRSHTVVVRKPLTAISTPLWSMHIRVN